MTEMTEYVELYHMISRICLTGAGFCSAAAAFLYIRMDMRKVLRFFYVSPGKKSASYCVDREILIVHTDEVV